MKGTKSTLLLVILLWVTYMSSTATAEQAGESALVQSIVEGNNKFALKLYDMLCGGSGNIFLSPYSISTALTMTWAGARGQTESQMADVLELPAKTKEAGSATQDKIRAQVHSAFGEIIQQLNEAGKSGGYELVIANALWGQKSYNFIDEFIRLVRMYYGGELTEVDFIEATEQARQTINAWVETKTNDRIKELIAKGMLDSATRLVLTNAIYFKGKWAEQFDISQSQQESFTLLNGQEVQADMMNKTSSFGYAETNELQVLSMPYVGNDLSMVILLPKQSEGLTELENTLTIESLSSLLEEVKSRKVIVSIPKFKMTSRFSLGAVLQSMGMVDAFSSKADFSGISGNRELSISSVVHKAFVEVDEEGTEAAAATGVTMTLTAVRPPNEIVFRADHPFMFMIRDEHKGSILFIGRLANPQS